jgi:exodeoxyribonuclease VII small subunit
MQLSIDAHDVGKDGVESLGQVVQTRRPRGHPHAPMSDKKDVDLEKALAELESLVEDLETGDLPLDTAMKKFEDGIKLTRTCQAALRDAEQKVQILLKSAGGEESLEEFDVED